MHEPGKYEREALKAEARTLLLKRKMAYGGLSQAEGQRLDAIEGMIGSCETPEEGKAK